MRKIFVSSIIWGLVFVLSACQTSQIETVELDTTASTSWGADVGSKVWLDRNFNGKKEIYEPGFAGITVNLWLDYGSDGLPDEKINSTLTDAKGQYRFNALDPDINYMVEFVAPSGYIFSSKRVTNEINSDFDSDANGTGFTDSIDLQKGIYNFRIDAALFKGSTQPTYPKGNTRIGERVWLDANADGIKQASEKGFANVMLNLWWDKNKDDTPDEIIKTVTTDAKGFYRFEGLGGNANYYLEVKAPEGYSISPKNNANAVGPYWDSDINPSTGFSDLLSLTPNTFNYTYNVGLSAGCTDTVNFNNEQLEFEIRRILDKDVGDISCSDMATVTNLNLDVTTADLRALDYAVNLSTLTLIGYKLDSGKNVISNQSLETISNLKKLRVLRITFSDITDIEPLIKLQSLKVLQISFSLITDIAPLVKLQSLERLELDVNCFDEVNSTILEDIQILENQGVEVFYNPQKNTLCSN